MAGVAFGDGSAHSDKNKKEEKKHDKEKKASAKNLNRNIVTSECLHFDDNANEAADESDGEIEAFDQGFASITEVLSTATP